MASKEAPLVERAQASYTQLSHAATNLNTASDQLDKAISVLETAIQKLNLGISGWAQISGGSHDPSDSWWSRDIGYTQIKNEWRIALRKTSGNYTDPESDSETVWPFTDAPRWMRVEAVGKIPDLLDKLTAQAADTTKKLKTKTEQAYQLAEVITEASQREDDWHAKLQAAMIETGLLFSAEAIAQAEVALVKNVLRIRVPKSFQLDLGDREITTALKHLGHPDLPFKVIFGKTAAEQTTQAGPK